MNPGFNGMLCYLLGGGVTAFFAALYCSCLGSNGLLAFLTKKGGNKQGGSYIRDFIMINGNVKNLLNSLSNQVNNISQFTPRGKRGQDINYMHRLHDVEL